MPYHVFVREGLNVVGVSKLIAAKGKVGPGRVTVLHTDPISREIAYEANEVAQSEIAVCHSSLFGPPPAPAEQKDLAQAA